MKFIKLAIQAGPMVAAIARQLAPQLQRMIRDNPEAFESMSHRFSKVVGTKKESPRGFEQRCRVLRDQVTYLYASANTSDVAHQAIAWRKELEAVEHALPVLQAMGRQQRMVEKRHLEKRLDHLSSEILAASLIDEVEDAELAGESGRDNSEDRPTEDR